MQIGTFRKNVMKTLAIKSTKLGLRTVSRNTARTSIARSTVSLKAHVGRLLQVLAPYIIGEKFSTEMRELSLPVMGDIGYDLTVLCRALRVKMPSATKKSKLVGTRTAALLNLDSLSTVLLEQVELGLFNSPKLTKVTKTLVLPGKGGAKEDREVDVIDTKVEEAAEALRQESMKAPLEAGVALYWRLHFDLFGQPPVLALTDKFARMKGEFPGVTFDVGEVKATATSAKPKAAKAAKTQPAQAQEPVSA